tara:strand:+ start:1037 stop:1675 length:639 start_codon:yes stop_codon:yes gene_type:complete
MENKINGMNRETWLNIMIDKAVPMFDKAGFKISDIRGKLKVSCSMMVGQRKSSKFGAIGQHLPTAWNKEQNHEMLISPTLEDGVQVVGVLIHEMCHAIQSHLYHDEKGRLTVKAHGKEFRKIAIAVGLEGKMTATTESPELKIKIEKWISEIGKYPHSEINLKGRKKQGVRNLKVQCQSCEWSFRTSNKNILLMASTKCLCCGDDEGLIVTF